MSLLQRRIVEASQKYYTDGTSDVSDAEFDNMLEQLREEDPNDPLLTDVGHGYKVAEDTTPGLKVRHKYGEAGSLPKCHNWKEFSLLSDTDHPQVASLKLDGISVVLYYEDNKLVQALTRGDGTTGIDITAKIKAIDPSLETCKSLYFFTGAVRGEILMSFANFEKYSAAHPEAKNPRNTTAGLINSKEIIDDLKYLDVVVYTVVGTNTQMIEFAGNYPGTLAWLQNSFGKVVPYTALQMYTEQNFASAMNSLQEQWYGVWPADGIVLADVTWEFQSCPEGFYVKYSSSAFKFPSEEKETVVKGVEWNLSKTKYLIPRINFETVELAGTQVSWATGYNAKWIETFGICTGTSIRVVKSGEIIPKIVSVYDSEGDKWICTDTSI